MRGRSTAGQLETVMGWVLSLEISQSGAICNVGPLKVAAKLQGLHAPSKSGLRNDSVVCIK